MKNIPYNKTLHELPYNSGISDRQIRRGNHRISINNLGQVSLQRRVKSAKRKSDWI